MLNPTLPVGPLKRRVENRVTVWFLFMLPESPRMQNYTEMALIFFKAILLFGLTFKNEALSSLICVGGSYFVLPALYHFSSPAINLQGLFHRAVFPLFSAFLYCAK